ncbi:hypothetical protein EON64_02435 [archaeon]|nr:MAG: hypothetical protein EON64_02435 [archaeon]
MADWKPPDRPGLDNSRLILAIESSDSAMASAHSEGSARTQQIYDSNYFYSVSLPGPLVSGVDARNNAREKEEENYEEGEDDDGDNEDDDDEERHNMAKFNNIPMSAALRQALGLPVQEQETDWRLPAASGLSNSASIVRFQ